MIDRTPEFLKAIKNCRNTDNDIVRKSSILAGRSLKPKTQFGKVSVEILSNITKLRDFLLENSKNNAHHFGEGGVEKDNDLQAESFIKACTQSLMNFKQKELPSSKTNLQLNAHKMYIIEAIETYLKDVSRMYRQQREKRNKQIADTRRLFSSLNRNGPKAGITEKVPEADVAKMKEKLLSYASNRLPYDSSDEESSPEDEAVFQEENTQLLNDMNRMMEEVKTIEGKVVEIARLHELFSEQVHQQEGDINIVSEKIVETSENVKDGNEELREAIKNNAGFRVWILFFLVMCSFSLLFLEWYS